MGNQNMSQTKILSHFLLILVEKWPIFDKNKIFGPFWASGLFGPVAPKPLEILKKYFGNQSISIYGS